MRCVFKHSKLWRFTSINFLRLSLFPGVLLLWHFLYSVALHPVSSLHIYTFVVSRVFMAGAASQAGDADSSRSPHPVSSLHIYTFVVSRAFMAGAASQAGDADSSRSPVLTSGLQGSLNVHRGALLLVPQWQCISSFVFYIFVTLVLFALWSR